MLWLGATRGKPVIDSDWFYLAAVPAVLIVGISKGGFGGGLGVAGVPIMALAVAPPQAAAILLPILCVMDLFSLYAWRGKWDRRNAVILIPASLIGIAVGTAMFRHLNVDVLKVFIGLIAVLFVLYHVARSRLASRPARGPGWGRGTVWGAIAGLTSFVAHAGGPPLTMYLVPQKLDRGVYQATTVLVFVAINYMKLGPYWWLGQFTTENLSTSLVLAPLAPIGIWLGVWLHRHVTDKAFYAVILAALVATGGKLIWEGVQGLL
jgi:uncharacterized membrane protein YfcA